MSQSPSLNSVTCTSADTEYPGSILRGAKQVAVRTNHETAVIRLAFESGNVATPSEPYINIPSGSEYFVTDISTTSVQTWYFASDTAGAVVTIEVWS